MRRQYHRSTALQHCLNSANQRLATERIKPSVWFIQHKNDGRMNHCASKRRSALQAAGQAINAVMGVLCQAKVHEATSDRARSIDCGHACEVRRSFKICNDTQR
jgi:hypothetical protein